LSLSGLALKAAVGFLAVIITVQSFSIAPISANVYGLQITVRSNFPTDITIQSVEAWAYVNSQLVAYGITVQPITLKPYTSATILGKVTFYTPLSELQRMPLETPVTIKVSVSYTVFFLRQSKEFTKMITVGEVAELYPSS
jgi:hypothetical protein